jgi:pimeloyl-ACP methyl ester carboxylesterase
VPAEKVIFVASFGSTPQRYLKVLVPFFRALAWTVSFVPAAAWRYFCLGAGATPADIARLKGVVAQVSPSVVAHRLKLVAMARTADDPRIDVPAYYLQAEGDRLVPRSAAERLRRLFSHFTLLRVPGPHFLLQASPVECAQLIAGIMLDAPK